MQRLAYYLLGLTCLIAVLQNPNKLGQRVYAVLLLIFSTFGAGIAIRQLYLQSLPFGQAPACAPSLNFMLKNFPLHETLKSLFYGSGDCAIVHWQLFGLSMAAWSLIFLICFFIAGLFLLVKTRSKKG
jgi:disulfide bond formation protein DsbB